MIAATLPPPITRRTIGQKPGLEALRIELVRGSGLHDRRAVHVADEGVLNEGRLGRAPQSRPRARWSPRAGDIGIGGQLAVHAHRAPPGSASRRWCPAWPGVRLGPAPRPATARPQDRGPDGRRQWRARRRMGEASSAPRLKCRYRLKNGSSRPWQTGISRPCRSRSTTPCPGLDPPDLGRPATPAWPAAASTSARRSGGGREGQFVIVARRGRPQRPPRARRPTAPATPPSAGPRRPQRRCGTCETSAIWPRSASKPVGDVEPGAGKPAQFAGPAQAAAPAGGSGGSAAAPSGDAARPFSSARPAAGIAHRAGDEDQIAGPARRRGGASALRHASRRR